jgi:hypothetical protein
MPSILGWMFIKQRSRRRFGDSIGSLVMEATLETEAETILQFISGLRGSLQVTFEEGTSAAWLHDLLKPQVTEVLVCDSRKNALLKVGNKNDSEDAPQARRTVVPEQTQPESVLAGIPLVRFPRLPSTRNDEFQFIVTGWFP